MFWCLKTTAVSVRIATWERRICELHLTEKRGRGEGGGSVAMGTVDADVLSWRRRWAKYGMDDVVISLMRN